MRFNINKNFILLLTTSIFLFSCSQKNNFDIDLSNLPKRRTKSLADEDKKELTLLQDDLPIKDLEPYVANSTHTFDSKYFKDFKKGIGKLEPEELGPDNSISGARAYAYL